MTRCEVSRTGGHQLSLRANFEEIVMLSVIGEIGSPRRPFSPYLVTHDGRPVTVPSSGGITYNVRVGDRASGWACDHVEPGATVRNKDADENNALAILSCIGNEAHVVSGDGKGSVGTVTGKHGGAEHLMIDFSPEVLDKLTIGDKVQVRAYGRGLRLLDAPEIKLMNMSVQLLQRLPAIVAEDGSLTIPVAGIVPPELMGSGVGSNAERGDYDIQTHDREVLEANGLANLRLGDIVAVRDQDHAFGRGYRKGSMVIGVIAHSDCMVAGHGPGLTTIMTCNTGKLHPVIDPDHANIASILGLR